jgi:sugar phosphate isomerase/epimerase
MRLGLITTGLLGHPFEDGLDLARRLGFETIEIGCAGFHSKRYGDPVLLAADAEARARWHDAITQRGLAISALAVHGAPLHPDPAVAELYDREFRSACQLAEQVGVDRLTLLAGLPGGGPDERVPNWMVTPFPPYQVESLEWQWEERALPYWRSHGQLAERHGLRLCFEMSPADLVFNPASLLRLRDAVGPVIGCNLDPSHLFWQGIDPLEVIPVLGDAIYHVHAKDTRVAEREVRLNGVLDAKPHAEARTRSWLFRTVGYGHGADWWCDFVSELRLARYDDVVSIEHEDDLVDPDEGLAKGAALLRAVLLEKPVGTRWWEEMG